MGEIVRKFVGGDFSGRRRRRDVPPTSTSTDRKLVSEREERKKVGGRELSVLSQRGQSEQQGERGGV